jgi:hypothetical protein
MTSLMMYASRMSVLSSAAAILLPWWPGMSSHTKSQGFLVAVGDTRDFRLAPFEINHDAPLAFFVNPYSHFFIFGGKFETGRGVSSFVDNYQRQESRRSVFRNRVQQPKFTF